MSKPLFLRILSLLLTFTILSGMLPCVYATTPETDCAAFGASFSVTDMEHSNYDWIDISTPDDELEALINSQPLHPQRTGWIELDQLIESLLLEAGEDASAYEKLRYAYDWMVQNVTYSWDGYSYRKASVKSYNSFNQINYLPGLTYETGLDKSIPDDMANRAYHILYAKKGVCYDYAIAFAVIARYVGIEAYAQTGSFVFEAAVNGTGHHGWAILMLDDTRYIFDLQRDARNYQYYGQNGYYFGILESSVLNTNARPSYKHQPEDITSFNQRLRQMLPVTATRYATVTVVGNATGGGRYALGSTATLQTKPYQQHLQFTGWFDANNECLSTEQTYTFPVTAPVTITARDTVDQEACISSGMTDLNLYAWYHPYTDYMLENGLMQGCSKTTFCPANTITRAEACQIFYNMEGKPAITTPAPFSDVARSAWYYAAVSWAAENKIVNGIGNGRFAPTAPISRQELAKMLYGYAAFIGADTEAAADLSSYRDAAQISKWAVDAMSWANANQMITGSNQNLLSPTASALRCEASKIITQFCRYVQPTA